MAGALDAFKDRTKSNEGFRDSVYLDSVGKKTIGYGFNIDDPAIRNYLPRDVVAGKRKLSKSEADKIFDNLFTSAQSHAINYVSPGVYNKLTPQAKYVVTDMAYQLGPTKLSKFVKLREALQTQDYNRASREIVNSDYYKQVTNRANRNIELLKTGVTRSAEPTNEGLARPVVQRPVAAKPAVTPVPDSPLGGILGLFNPKQ